MSDARIETFLQQQGWASARRTPVDAQASTRLFTRLTNETGKSAILMDTGGITRALPKHPYEQTIMPDFRPFVQVDRILASLGMSVPEIYAESADGHLLLVEDFGLNEFQRLLKSGSDPLPLFTLATDTLLELQRRFAAQKPDMTGLRNYTPDFFLTHLAVIPEVYMPLLCGRGPSASDRAAFDRLWKEVLTRACATPTSLMLRDFNVSNVFHLKDRPGINAMGLIDFETAGTGPAIYDIVAIMRDSRYLIDKALADTCIDRFIAASPGLTRPEFDIAYNILGTMRQVQWAGSCSLYTTQGRPGFLARLPGIWKVIEGTLAHPVMKELAMWFDDNIPRSARNPAPVEA